MFHFCFLFCQEQNICNFVFVWHCVISDVQAHLKNYTYCQLYIFFFIIYIYYLFIYLFLCKIHIVCTFLSVTLAVVIHVRIFCPHCSALYGVAGHSRRELRNFSFKTSDHYRLLSVRTGRPGDRITVRARFFASCIIILSVLYCRAQKTVYTSDCSYHVYAHVIAIQYLTTYAVNHQNVTNKQPETFLNKVYISENKK